MGEFIHVDPKRVVRGMHRHQELMKGDERWQDEERQQLEDIERVKKHRDQRFLADRGGE